MLYVMPLYISNYQCPCNIYNCRTQPKKPFGDVGILAKYHDNNNNNNNKPKAKLCVSFLINHEMPVFRIASKATHFIPILAVCA